MTNLEKIYSKISKDKEVTKALVETIFKSQFELVKKTIEAGEDKPIRLERFGVFRVKSKRREYVDIINKNKVEQHERESRDETDRGDFSEEI